MQVKMRTNRYEPVWFVSKSGWPTVKIWTSCEYEVCFISTCLSGAFLTNSYTHLFDFFTLLMDRLLSYASLQDFGERSPGSSVNTWTGCRHVPPFDKHLTLSVQTRAQYISWSIGLWDPVVVGSWRKAANWLKQCGGMLWWWPVPSSLGSPP